MISSAVLVQVNRWQRSFQPSMKARMAVSWPTLSKDPRQVYTGRSGGPGRRVQASPLGRL